uniref:Uncharacterized protein n=1 Tax=Rhizophora mucronata TaxID=61149 RepID=A0A2P2QMK4_RHIMU
MTGQRREAQNFHTESNGTHYSRNHTSAKGEGVPNFRYHHTRGYSCMSIVDM